MADYTGIIVAIPATVSGDAGRTGFLVELPAIVYGRPNRDVGAASITLGGLTATSAGAVAVDGDASVTLGAATLSSSGTVIASATTGQLAVTLGALSIASAGTVAEFVPSRERTKRVPSWPRVLLAENPDRVIELYRPPRTVRTAA